MPYDDPEPDDPTVLVGMTAPGDAESMREMAYAFAEEFLRLGHSPAQVENLFRNPWYALAHRAWLELGDDAMREIVAEQAALWTRPDRTTSAR